MFRATKFYLSGFCLLVAFVILLGPACAPPPEVASTKGEVEKTYKEKADATSFANSAIPRGDSGQDSMADEFSAAGGSAGSAKQKTTRSDRLEMASPDRPVGKSAASGNRMFKKQIQTRGFGTNSASDSEPNQVEDARPRAMAVMSPAEAEADREQAQTTIEVFYATDRRSKYGISPGDWLRVHGAALLALVVYLSTFGAVFLTDKKVFYGVLAFGSLCAFLYLGQASSVKWQKEKRLAVNNDASYLSEIRSATLDGMLDYGTCHVTIPPDHRVGHVDSPSLFKLEFVEDADKHVVLQRVIRQEQKELFFRDLRESIDESGGREALVFVHGYNVGFENAVKRTAQIAHDLKFDGAPICYSWSSHGALSNYTKDMANADATVVALQAFLQELVGETDKTTIHLIAHSMGNRALLQALDRIAVGNPQAKDVFGQLVMAAPDVSAVDFKHRFAPSAMRVASSVTLYASSRDRALLASTEIHGHNRAGLAGPNLVVMEGMDTIDVSEIDTSLIGHSYYGDHPELIKDLRAVVELAAPADQRQWLMRIIKPGSLDFFRFHRNDGETRSADESKLRLDRR